MPNSGGGRKPDLQPELEKLSIIIKNLKNQFCNINWKDADKICKVITEEIPEKVVADKAYQNAMKNNGRKTARIEHDTARWRVMFDLLADHTARFKHLRANPSFRKLLADGVYGVKVQ